MNHSVWSTMVVSLLALSSTATWGQTFPTKPIRIYAADPGGTVDLLARQLALGISGPLGQQVVVENRPAQLNGDIVARATPDGYTLLIAAGTFLIGPMLQKVSYDPVKDFSPITATTRAPNVLLVHPSLPAKSVKELIALAKARPGQLNYSAGGIGGGPYLAAELFKSMAGVNIVLVPYKGTGSAISAVVSGEVQVTFGTPGSVAAYLKSGRLRALAVTSSEPSTLAPGLPTIAAAGVPGYEASTTHGIWAPAKTPEPIIHRLNQEIVRYLEKPDVRERLSKSGLDIVASSPDEFAAAIKSEISRMGKVIRDAGIRAE
jgi:tripartite-type tricarboxylate transporter receptor subunit TctC